MSSVYYALFHCLSESNANMIVGGKSSKNRSDGAWIQAYRALQHNTARNRCEKQSMMGRFPPDVQQFADLFCRAQVERHAADYNPDRHFVREDVEVIAIEALVSIVNFRKVAAKDRRAFAVYLLLDQRQQ